MSDETPPNINVQIGDKAEIHGSVIVNTGTMNTIVQVAQAVTSLHQLRAPLNDFVGRHTERAALRAALVSQRADQAVVAAICGMGGLGKTELALRVAHDLLNTYPDAQIFLSLRASAPGTVRTLADALRDAIRAFEPHAALSDDVEMLAARYRGHLGGKQALVLLDDVPDDATVRLFFPPVGCALLVTSRARLTLDGQGTVIDLALFGRDEAHALLVDDAPRLKGTPELEALLNYCGDLPLAVRVAGSTLAGNPALSPERYLARLADEKRRPDALRYGGTDVYAVLGVGYDLLAAEDARLAQRWCMLGVCPAPFEAVTAGVIWAERNQDQRDDDLGVLLRRSLLRYDAERGQYRVHGLLRDVAAVRRTPEDDAAARLRHAAFYGIVAQQAQQLYKQGHENILKGLRLFDANWQHIQAGAAYLTQAQTTESDRILVQYAIDLYELVFLRIPPAQQQRWYEATLAATRRLDDEQGEARAHIGLAAALRRQRSYDEAQEQFTRGLALAHAHGDWQSVSMALLGLGNIASELNKDEASVEEYKRALAVAEQTNDQRGIALALVSLSTAYVKLGNTAESLRYAKQGLALLQAIGDWSTEGVVLNTIGMLYSEHMRDYKQAVQFYEQSRARFHSNGEQGREATVCFNLFESYQALGQTKQALTYLAMAVEIEQAMGHPQAAEDAALLHRLQEAMEA
jgi:tetratricopeptide (TPR) repeat protein